MIGEEVISKRKVSVVETLDYLNERKKIGALSYEQQTSYDYCKKFSYLPKEQVKELIAKLMEKGLPEDIAVNIADVFPGHESTLSVIISKHTVDIKEIQAILDEYREISKEYRQTLDIEIIEEKEAKDNEAKEKEAKEIEDKAKASEVEDTAEVEDKEKSKETADKSKDKIVETEEKVKIKTKAKAKSKTKKQPESDEAEPVKKPKKAKKAKKVKKAKE